jgi:hypothetical protein
MARLEILGRMAWLVVPGDDHRFDAKPWLHRYPTMHVATPAGACDEALEVVPVESTAPDFGDADARWVTVRGTREHEAALVVRGAKGTTIDVNDLIGNLRHEHGFTEWSEIADLRCVLVSHGEPIVDDPRAELRRLSESLR